MVDTKEILRAIGELKRENKKKLVTASKQVELWKKYFHDTRTKYIALQKKCEKLKKTIKKLEGVIEVHNQTLECIRDSVKATASQQSENRVVSN